MNNTEIYKQAMKHAGACQGTNRKQGRKQFVRIYYTCVDKIS